MKKILVFLILNIMDTILFIADIFILISELIKILSLPFWWLLGWISPSELLKKGALLDKELQDEIELRKNNLK
jgi:hypothetical protein